MKPELEQHRGPGRRRGRGARGARRRRGVRGVAATAPHATSRAGPSRPSRWPSRSIAAVLSPPGLRVRRPRAPRGRGRRRPARALHAAGPGRLLVTAGGGTWIVYADGSRRLLGTYDDASWSPFGRYVVATGAERARRRSTPRETFAGRWRDPPSGSRAGRAVPPTRASPTSAATGSMSSRATAPATSWRATYPQPPFHPRGARDLGFILAYAGTRRARPLPHHGEGRLALERDAARPTAVARVVERRPAAARPLAGQGLDPRRRPGGVIGGEAAPDVVAVAYRPGTNDVCRAPPLGGRKPRHARRAHAVQPRRRLRGLTWSPDGRWLLVGSPASDQWVFIRADGAKIVAVSNISAQFHSPAFPEVEGWCCGGPRIATMLEPGDPIPRARVWTAPREDPLDLARRARGRRASRSSASTSSTGRPAERTRCCSCVTGARPRSRKHPSLRDLPRLAVVARVLGDDAGGRERPLLSDWNGEATRGFGVRSSSRAWRMSPRAARS